MHSPPFACQAGINHANRFRVCVFAVIFNILCLEVACDSMRLFYWRSHYIYDLIVLMFMYYTVCYFTGIFYAVVRQISVIHRQ